VTCGLEGISERLRASIGKRFTDDFIIDKFQAFVERAKGVAMISAYFIADLPGEDLEDWEAIWALFEKIERKKFSRMMTFKPVLNPLSPKQFTDLADALIHPFRDYEARWLSLLRRNQSQWGFRLVETLVWGPWERMLDVVVNRGGERAYNVVRKIPLKLIENKPVKAEREAYARKLVQVCAESGLTNELLGIDCAKEF